MLKTSLFFLVAINFSAAISEPNNGSRTVLEHVPCERGWYYWGEKCYQGKGRTLRQKLPWEEARSNCRRLGGDLVSIESQKEQDFVVTFLQLDLKDRTWIGLNDRKQEGDFRWTDGTVYNYTNWKAGAYPNGTHHTGRNCIHLIFEPDWIGITGTWIDKKCEKEEKYICEMKPNHRKKSPNPMLCSNEGIRGWEWAKSCYHVIKEHKSWHRAESHCRNYFKGHLVSVLDKVEDIFLDYILHNITEKLWIGIKIKEQIQQMWTSGWYVSHSGLKSDTIFRDGTCVARKGINEWITIPCTEELPFICKVSEENPPLLKSPPKGYHCPVEFGVWRDLGGEYCYHFETEKAVSFYEALFECIRRGGNLASVHSKEENEMIVSFVKYRKSGKSSWIGLLRTFPQEDEFGWTDGSTVNYVNWAFDEPFNYRNSESCVEVSTYSFGYIYTWNDVSCEKKQGYVCSVKKILTNLSSEEEKCKTYCISPRSYLNEVIQQSEDAEEMQCSTNAI